MLLLLFFNFINGEIEVYNGFIVGKWQDQVLNLGDQDLEIVFLIIYRDVFSIQFQVVSVLCLYMRVFYKGYLY